ncbi:MAG TPA: serine hydrolase domain-containing protein [Gemmatimonadaceae bacterium]
MLLSSRFALVASATLAFPLAAPAQGVSRPDSARTAAVDAVFAPYDRTDSPGCALGIYENGRIAYARGYGMANLELMSAITPQSVFDIGSTSKQTTAMSIMLLASQGKLSLDDDVRKYVPELPKYEHTITIRHILTHTSGLRDYLTLFSLAGIDDADLTTDDDALQAIVRQKELNFQPGEQWLYSNSGFFLASVIVKRASGKSLPEFARENIFTPLGMSHTRYNDDHRAVIPMRATGYDDRGDGTFATDMSDFEQTGDGAIQTSIEDMQKWDENFYTGQVGGRAALDAMQTPMVLNNGRKQTYALGLGVDSYRGLRTVSHGGSWAGYRAELLRFPEKHTSFAVLCNLATTNPSALARRVADVWLASSLGPAQGFVAFRPASAGASAGATHAYVGLYRNPTTGELRRVSVRGDSVLYDNMSRAVPLQAIAPARFHPLGGGEIFFTDATGGRRYLSAIDASGDTARFERVAEATPAATELAQYAGSWYSPELDATYTLRATNGKLVLARRRSPAVTLQPTYADAFAGDGLLLRFTRQGGAVKELLLDAGRIRNVRFMRTVP